jgi:hypothetical protein
MAAFVMRDTDIARDLDLTDLFWAACNDGSVHRNDIEPVLNEIEEVLDAREAIERELNTKEWWKQ